VARERSGGLNGQTYTPGINRFNALLAEWRAKGDLEGLELRYA
jgi:cyclohexanone monooxygenase